MWLLKPPTVHPLHQCCWFFIQQVYPPSVCRREVDSVVLPYLNRARLSYAARAFLSTGKHGWLLPALCTAAGWLLCLARACCFYGSLPFNRQVLGTVIDLRPCCWRCCCCCAWRTGKGGRFAVPHAVGLGLRSLPTAVPATLPPCRCDLRHGHLMLLHLVHAFIASVRSHPSRTLPCCLPHPQARLPAWLRATRTSVYLPISLADLLIHDSHYNAPPCRRGARAG